MQYTTLIQIKTNITSGTVYTEPVADQSTQGGQAFISGVGQSLKLSTNAAVFKRVSLLIGGGGRARRLGGQAPFSTLTPALSLHLVVGLRNLKFSAAKPCKSKNRLTW